MSTYAKRRARVGTIIDELPEDWVDATERPVFDHSTDDLDPQLQPVRRIGMARDFRREGGYITAEIDILPGEPVHGVAGAYCAAINLASVEPATGEQRGAKVIELFWSTEPLVPLSEAWA